MIKKITLTITAFLLISPLFAAPKVVVLAVDGASENVIRDLSRRKSIPHLTKLFQQGWYGSINMGGGLSPTKWMTVFSGCPVGIHGVASWEINGESLSSNHCRVKRVWEILSDHGYHVGVFQVLATSPADPIRGVLLTDRWTSFDRPAMERGFPPEILPRLARHFENNVRGLATRDEVVLMRTQETAALQLLLELDEEEAFRLIVFYLRSVDEASHGVWKKDTEIVGGDLRVKPGGELEKAYLHADAAAERVMGLASPEDYVFFLSDHGFSDDLFYSEEVPAGRGRHSAEGIFFLKGPGIRPGRLSKTIDGLALVPTMLDIFQVPASEQMPGESLLSAGKKLLRVKTYTKTISPHTPAPYSAEERKKLEQLNYLK
ncbi:MAG TPA: alkaline phosphatase family protein [Elusimicrobiota bacterium]|nr:alkaline phosphatase family protein [Elusimicrobiota bacterium]